MEKVLPKGWVETQLIELLQTLESGTRPKGGVQGILEGVPSIGGEHLSSDGSFNFKNVKYIPTQFAERLSRGRIFTNDILIVKDGATTGKTSFVDKRFPFDSAFVNEHVFICRPSSGINSKILFYFMRSKIGQDRIMSNFAGAAQGGINSKFASNTLLPLPPLAEQERIVAKLDKLFAQHEKIKRALDRIPQLLKTFRQQVLTQAVTGKLTEKWREGKDLEEWETLTIKEISETRLGKMLDKNKNSGNEYPYLGNVDVQWNGINVDNLKKIRIEDAEFEKFKLEKGDVLVCEGGEAGRAAIWQQDKSDIIFQKALHRVRLYSNFRPEILLYNLELDTKSGKISELYTGTTIKHLTGQNFAKYKLKYAPLQEQKEIVRRVESLFAKADAIEARYDTLKAKIDSLPQAILHKAFKGELVPQLPTDGDAKDLLAEIMALKKEVKGKKK